MKFKIYRKKWRCGDTGKFGYESHGVGSTALLNDEGYMCCLGQCANQLGVRKQKLLDRSTPEDIDFVLYKKRNIPVLTILGHDSKFSMHAIEINDESNTTLEQKEKLLKRLFSKFKHQVEFVGQYEKA